MIKFLVLHCLKVSKILPLIYRVVNRIALAVSMQLLLTSFVVGGATWAREPDYASKALVELTSEEASLAKELGYSVEAMLIVKQLTSSKLTKVTMKPYGSWKWENKFQQRNYFSDWKKEDFDKVKEIIAKYPELGPALNKQIENIESSKAPVDIYKLMKQRMSKKTSSEDVKYRFKLNEFAPYLAYDRDKKGLDGFAVARLIPGVSAKKAYFELKKTFAKVNLPKEYLPVDAVSFKLYGDSVLQNIVTLQDKLAPLGYTVYGSVTENSTRSFQNKEEATKFAAGKYKVRTIRSRSSKRNFDPSKYNPKAKPVYSFRNNLYLAPGDDVTKLDSNRWLVKHPEKYRVERKEVRAVLVRGLNPVQFVKLSGSSGPNYNVTNKMVRNKLKEWNRKYGIRVLSAQGDSLKLIVKEEPKDLSRFLSEIFLFCPDAVELSPDMMYSASAMREFASRFRKNRLVGLWWD